MLGLPDIGNFRSPSRLQPTWVARLEGWSARGGLWFETIAARPPHHEADPE